MSFVLPAKYSEDTPIPKDSTVSIKRIPAKTVAVTIFSGFVTDDDVRKKEEGLQRVIFRDGQVRAKANAQPEVAQYNPPFTPPFMRRNELSFEVEEL